MTRHLTIIAAALLASSSLALAQSASGGASAGGSTSGGSVSSPSAAPDTSGTTTDAPAASGGTGGSTTTGGSVQGSGSTATPAPRADSPQAPADRNSDTAQTPSNETTASISAEQETQLQSAFQDAPSGDAVTLDVDVAVGAVIPATVTLQPLPPRIVEVVPAYSGYRYVRLADGRIVIVEPASMKVVYIVTG